MGGAQEWLDEGEGEGCKYTYVELKEWFNEKGIKEKMRQGNKREKRDSEWLINKELVVQWTEEAVQWVQCLG